jgi:endonuclease YncB( thermonuclease family)
MRTSLAFFRAAVFHLFVLVCLLVQTATAQTGDLRAGGEAGVSEVIDGDTIRLDDGRQVRLVGIQAPKLPLGRKGFKKWPLADESKEALERLLTKKVVKIHYGGRQVDRHGRLLAHLFTASDNIWIQQAMLHQGMARVYSFADNRALVAEMLAAERVARDAARGIWALRWYRVRSHAEAGDWIGTFQLVSGQVVTAAVVRGRLYINFGTDWRSDFTISVAPRAYKLFRRVGLDPDNLTGKRVEVRGWLKSYNGPLIEATHPEQIVLTPVSPRRPDEVPGRSNR